MRQILALAACGAAGTLARAGIGLAAYRLFPGRFPWGTLAVNVVGSLLFALVAEAALESGFIAREWRIPLTVGFLGAFTTFSTFGYETIALLEEGAIGLALVNVGANLVLCLGAIWVGLVAGRALAGGT